MLIDIESTTRLGVAWESLHQTWKTRLCEEWGTAKFRQLAWFLDIEYQHNEILPDSSLIFNAFNLTPFEKVNVVILGQDPYPNPEFAHGLSFSVRPGVKIPLSLLNIFRELSEDTKSPIRRVGTLSDWAQHGVLLLNTCLTVKAHSPGSHVGKGWEQLTDRAISKLSKERANIVFILWGSHAIRKESLIDPTKHLILKSSHPSFRSYERSCGPEPPFKNSRPFSKANEYLALNNKPCVQWTTTD